MSNNTWKLMLAASLVGCAMQPTQPGATGGRYHLAVLAPPPDAGSDGGGGC